MTSSEFAPAVAWARETLSTYLKEVISHFERR